MHLKHSTQHNNSFFSYIVIFQANEHRKKRKQGNKKTKGLVFLISIPQYIIVLSKFSFSPEMAVFLEAALQTLQEVSITLLFQPCWKTSSSPLCSSPSLMIQRKRSPGGKNIIHSRTGNYLACLLPLISLVLTFLLQVTYQNIVLTAGSAFAVLLTLRSFGAY